MTNAVCKDFAVRKSKNGLENAFLNFRRVIEICVPKSLRPSFNHRSFLRLKKCGRCWLEFRFGNILCFYKIDRFILIVKFAEIFCFHHNHHDSTLKIFDVTPLFPVYRIINGTWFSAYYTDINVFQNYDESLMQVPKTAGWDSTRVRRNSGPNKVRIQWNVTFQGSIFTVQWITEIFFKKDMF